MPRTAMDNQPMAKANRLRLIILGLILCLFLGAFIAISTHPEARQLFHSPHLLGQSVRHWTAQHGLLAEVALFVLYILLTLVALPVWWLNILAGYSFGLVGGTIRCVVASAIAATITAGLWKWLAADIADHKLFTRVKLLRLLHHYAETGGVLVVLLTRLAHLLPFGLSNYIFGMLGITWPAVLIGTLIGGIPSVALYVSLGAGHEWHSHWLFISIIGLLAIGGIILGGVIYARHKEHPPATQEPESP